MKEDQSWRLPFAIFLGSIVITWAWATADESVCNLATRIVAADDPTKTVASCLDFWVNRYQTLVGAAAAIFAALYAGWWVQRQLKVTERQLATDRISLYDARIAALGEHKSTLHRFEETFDRLNPKRLIVNGFQTYDDTIRIALSGNTPVAIDVLRTLVDEAEDRLSDFERSVLIRPSPQQVLEAERAFAKCAHDFLREWRRITGEVNPTSVLSMRFPGTDPWRHKRIGAFKATYAAINKVQVALDYEYGSLCRLRDELQREIH